MNSLHKKRQTFRQAIRSKSIQDLFRRKRLQFFQQLKFQNHPLISSYQSLNPKQYRGFDYTLAELTKSSPETYYQILVSFLESDTVQLSVKEQQKIFNWVSRQEELNYLQKMDIISRLINRKQFFLDLQIQSTYGWKKLLDQFIAFLSQNSHSETHIELALKYQNQPRLNINALEHMVCYSLIKIWQIKPKCEYFINIQKSYHLIHQKIPNVLSLTLLAELSYEKTLLPNSQLISKLLALNINRTNEIKIFRTLEILKNFIHNLRAENTQVHQRQLIFEYLNWIKIQVDLLLSNFFMIQPQTQTISQTQPFQHLISFQTRYCLIYLLFTTLNKLFETNEKEKEHLSTQQIIILNDQLFNFKENHTTLKFLIQEGKHSADPHQKKNIFKTLSFFVSFLEMSNFDKQPLNKRQQNFFEAELEEIQQTFQGTELDWFESIN